MDKRIFWLAAGSFTISTEGFVVSSLLPDIAADAGISIPLAGCLITAFALAYALGGPVLATLTGRQDRRSIIVWTMAFFVFGNLMAAQLWAQGGLAYLEGRRDEASERRQELSGHLAAWGTAWCNWQSCVARR